jgi:histidyl-tRNA synthetase
MLSIPPEDSLKELEKLIGHLPQAQEGIKEIRNLFSFLETAKVPEEYYRFDLAIIRGLSYYTGPVFEIAIRDGGVGSVGGGGRYDELVKLYSGQDIPAAGGSFGIERIIEIITDRQLVAEQGGVSIMIAPVDESAMSASISVAADLRNNGKNVLLYPEAGAKLQKQLKYADKKKIRYVILIGENEVAGQMVKIKDMSTGEEKEIKTDQLASFAF